MRNKSNLFNIIMSVLIVLLALSSCFKESSSDESSISASSTDESTENSSTVNSTVENNESSAPVQEAWIETETSGNENITTEYRNFGSDWTKTIETVNDSGQVIKKQEYEIVNKDIIKTTNWNYSDDGELSSMNSEEHMSDGTTVRAREVLHYDENIREIAQFTFQSGDSYIFSGESSYTSLLNDGLVAQINYHRETLDDFECLVTNILYYRDGAPHHHKISYNSISNTDDFNSVVVSDASGKNIYEEKLVYSNTSGEVNHSKIYYRGSDFNGYVRIDYSEGVIEYYNSVDGVECEWFYKVMYSPETKEVSDVIYNEKYERKYILELLEEGQRLAAEFDEFQSDVDYKPIG